jgi:septal ring factor EnvC (AmiA/AmiB activator)
MRILPTCVFLLAASTTIPAICQSSSQNTSRSNIVSPGGSASGGSTPTQPATGSAPVVSSSALKADIARQDRVIQNQVNAQQDLLKKNKELMKQAKKLDDKNKKLESKNRKLEAKNRAMNAEKNNVQAQNADLARKSDAIKAAEKPIQTAP